MGWIIGKGIGIPFRMGGSGLGSSYWTKLTFDDIANVPVTDATSVSDWNTFFDLPTYGTPFTSVDVIGNEVTLSGGSGITLKGGIFSDSSCATSLLKLEDLGCIIDIECEEIILEDPSYSHTIRSPFLHYYETIPGEPEIFNVCSNLTEVIFTSVTNIGTYAFGGCSSLSSITIPNTAISIGDSAFFGTALTSVVIPDSVTSIGDVAFQACEYLTSITLSNNITSIGPQTFDGCSSLLSIVIPDSVTSIGDMAFSGTALTEITIPKNVVSLGNSAFPSSLMVVNMYPMVAPTTNFSFDQVGATLHIVAGAEGYDVLPWNNTFYFVSVIQDL